MRSYEFTAAEMRVLKRLDTPEKIQSYLEATPYNMEKKRETCRSPRVVLKLKEAHCIEGAIFAAAALRVHGKKPLIVDLAAKGDHDHVICVFKKGKYWGAISKSKFHSLGYRDPVYASVRELALSYFPSYHNYRGQKTLTSVSVPFDLSYFDDIKWMTCERDLWEIGNHLFTIKHENIIPKGLKLRRVPDDAQFADTAHPKKGWKNSKPKKGY